MVGRRPLVALVRFFVKMTPHFLLRGSCCLRKLLAAFYFAVPVEDSVMAACGWSLATRLFLKRKVASSCRDSNSGLWVGMAPTLATRPPGRRWWMLDDGWWIMGDGWWMMGDGWWVSSGGHKACRTLQQNSLHTDDTTCFTYSPAV